MASQQSIETDARLLINVP